MGGGMHTRPASSRPNAVRRLASEVILADEPDRSLPLAVEPEHCPYK